jgi:hypothetical protein
MHESAFTSLVVYTRWNIRKSTIDSVCLVSQTVCAAAQLDKMRAKGGYIDDHDDDNSVVFGCQDGKNRVFEKNA